MKNLMIILLTVCILITTGCAVNISSTTNEDELFGTFTYEELKADADRLMTIIEAYSAKLYTDEDELNAAYAGALEQLTEGMSGLEFIRAMKPVVASLRCGHTHLFPSGNFGSARLLPLDIEVIDGKLYMSRSAVSTDMPSGSEILAINDRSADQILQMIMNGMSKDGWNETSRINFLGRFFSREYAYNVEYTGSFQIEYLTSDGKSGVETIGTMNADALNRKLGEKTSKDFDSVFTDDYAVLTIKSFNPSSRNSIQDYNDYIDEFFMNLEEKGIQKLILDVRGNSGGDPLITSHLFSYLETEPHPYFASESPSYYPGLKDPISMAENHFDGDLYILIDGGCFSSTGHILALLKYQEAGTFIGEESGGSYVCTDSSRGVNLPNTNVYFHYSTEAWKVAVEGFEPGRGIMPDIEIKRTINDYLNDNDPVMDYALEIISGN